MNTLENDKQKSKYITNIITAIRESHQDIELLYMEGQCYNFHKILLSIFPESECWYNQKEGHIYTKIGLHFYDIRGKVYVKESDIELMDFSRGDKPHRWGSRDRRRLVDVTNSKNVWYLNKDFHKETEYPKEVIK